MSNPLKWSSSPPDREGWYWRKVLGDDIYPKGYIEVLEIRRNGFGLCSIQDEFGSYEYLEGDDPDPNIQWAGPLPEPEEEND